MKRTQPFEGLKGDENQQPEELSSRTRGENETDVQIAA
jgi:hypothetical protein